jgi:glycosyltransferase involved in cell wall biosynthesis
MRLTLLTDGIYPYQVGGMQKHSYYLAEFLARQEVEVQLFHLGGKGIIPFSAEAKPRIKEQTVPFPPPGRLPGHYVRNSYRHAQALVKATQTTSPSDFIYAQGYTAWAILEHKTKGGAWPPVCVNFHGMEALQPPASRRNWLEQVLLAPPMRRQLRQADYVQSLGGKLTDLLLDLGVNRERIWEIPIGLDAGWLAPEATKPHSPRRFIFVGRYERRKGVEELNQALHGLRSQANFRFDFVGPVPEALQMSGEAFTYHGLIREQSQVKHLLDQADVLVSPSHAEGMPTVILEAMARGCAIIATDVGAVAEQVDDSVGWLIPNKDVVALREAMVNALSIPTEELTNRKQAAQMKVQQHFLWDRIATLTKQKIEAAIT